MRLHLIDDWRTAWRWGSVQLAALAGSVVAAIVAAWPFFSWTLTTLFRDYPTAQYVIAALGFMLVTGLPIATRLLTTKKPPCETSHD